MNVGELIGWEEVCRAGRGSQPYDVIRPPCHCQPYFVVLILQVDVLEAFDI